MNNNKTFRRQVVALAILAGVVAAMQVGKAPPAITQIRAELAISLVVAGWVMSLFNATSALLGAVTGVFSDLIGHRRTVFAGLMCMCLGSIAGGLSASAAYLLLSRFVEGVGFVAVVVAAPSIIAAATPVAERRLVIGVWSAYMPAGIALMMLTTPPLLDSLGWRGLWFANAALLAGFAILLATVIRRADASPAHIRTLRDISVALASPGAWLLAACFAAYAAQFMGLVSWLPTFLMEQMNRSTSEAAVVVALIVALNVPGNLLGGWLLQLGIPRWLLIAFGSGALGLLALGIFSADISDAAKLTMAAAFSTIGGFIPSSVLTGVPEHAASPGMVGTTNGMVVQGSNMGSLFAPPLFAFVLTPFGDWAQASWLFVLAGGIGVVLAVLLRHTEQTMPHTSD